MAAFLGLGVLSSTCKTLFSLNFVSLSVVSLSPAFSSDCLETIEELNEENREIFMENGGKEFGYIPCLNDREDHILLLTSLLENELHGWV